MTTEDLAGLLVSIARLHERCEHGLVLKWVDLDLQSKVRALALAQQAGCELSPNGLFLVATPHLSLPDVSDIDRVKNWYATTTAQFAIDLERLGIIDDALDIGNRFHPNGD